MHNDDNDNGKDKCVSYNTCTIVDGIVGNRGGLSVVWGGGGGIFNKINFIYVHSKLLFKKNVLKAWKGQVTCFVG